MGFRRHLLPSLLACALLQGCVGPLTEWVWSRPDEGNTKPVDVTAVACEVQRVTSVGSDPSGIGVQFSVPATEHTPAHLERYTTGQPAYIELSPPRAGGHRDWRELPGAGMFSPSTWALRVTSANYFWRPTSNARVAFFGAIPRSELGELYRPEQLPRALREILLDIEPRAEGALEQQCLAAFRARSWMPLLSPQPPRNRYLQRPMVWLDGDFDALTSLGVTSLDSEDNDSSLTAKRLLARFENAYGDVRYAMIPVPVLIQGAELQLVRDGEIVRWSRSQIWSGQLARAPAPGTTRQFPLPMHDNSFVYRHYREYEPSDGGIVADAARVIATPFTAILDFLILTNENLANLVRELTGQRAKTDDPGKGKL